MSLDLSGPEIAEQARALRDDLLRAGVFLTRLPLPWPDAEQPQPLARALRLAPLVGAGIGVAAAAVYALALWLGLPALAAAGLAVAATFCLTGGLHEDGLADVADGFGGGATAAQKLAIMRDSRVGSYGVAAIALALLLRVAALAALPVGPAALALVAGHARSRAPLCAALRGLPSARPGGLGADAGVPSRASAGTALALGAAIALLAFGPATAALATILVLGLSGLGGWLAMRQVGGYTGDVLGMLQQAGEVAVLLLAAALLAA